MIHFKRYPHMALWIWIMGIGIFIVNRQNMRWRTKPHGIIFFKYSIHLMRCSHETFIEGQKQNDRPSR